MSTETTQIVETINRTRTVIAAMWLTVVGTLGILFLPLLVGALVGELSFSETQAGNVAAAEMAGVALASGLGIFWVRRVNWVSTAILSAAIFIGANWLSMGIGDYMPMLLVRFLVGLASGALLAIGMACQSDAKNADHIFGYWVACQMSVSTLGYLLLPGIRERWGIDGFLLSLILLGVTAFVAVLLLPTRGLDRRSASANGQTALLTGVLALTGALLFFMAQGGLWAFLERLGLASDLTTKSIGTALAVSSVFGILGGVAKNWIADFSGPLSPFYFVVAGELLMLALFAINPGFVVFAIAVCLLQFCWAMGMASFLAAFNTIDASGGLVLLLMSIAKVGYALGPALMGWLIVGGNYQPVLFATGALVVVGIVVAITLLSRHSKANQAQ